jgi:hypothetical protein
LVYLKYTFRYRD